MKNTGFPPKRTDSEYVLLFLKLLQNDNNNNNKNNNKQCQKISLFSIILNNSEYKVV